MLRGESAVPVKGKTKSAKGSQRSLKKSEKTQYVLGLCIDFSWCRLDVVEFQGWNTFSKINMGNP